MKKYLLLGGTGPIGIHLVKKLQEDICNEIYVTSRRDRTSSDHVHYIKGNAKDMKFLKATIKSLGGNITAIIDFMVWSTPEFDDVCTLLLSNCSQYVFLSTSRLYANIGNAITEVLHACSM